MVYTTSRVSLRTRSEILIYFYVGILGLRLVKKTVNQDDPSVYHLFYADDKGSPGGDLTFFEYPTAKRGRAGDGFAYRIIWRINMDSFAYWQDRFEEYNIEHSLQANSLLFWDHEGLEHELVGDDSNEVALISTAADVPLEHALRGFAGVRVYNSDAAKTRDLLLRMGFEKINKEIYKIQGETRSGLYYIDPAPTSPAVNGYGTIHHVAFSSSLEQQRKWSEYLQQKELNATQVIDRFYFQSVYFREPGGVLFEIATEGPGFTIDEDADKLGESLSLPPKFQPYRKQIEANLRPIIIGDKHD